MARVTLDDDYPIHPLAAMFPPLPKDDFSALVASIKTDGLQTDIDIAECVERDNVEMVIDGSNRQRACRTSKVKPTYRHLGKMTEAEIAAYIVAANILRRHDNKGKMAIILAKMQVQDEETFSSDTEENDKRGKGRPSILPKVPGVSPARISDALMVVRLDADLAEEVIAAKLPFDTAVLRVRLGQRAIKKLKQELVLRHEELTELREKDPDLVRDVEDGVMTLDKAWSLLAEREELDEIEAEEQAEEEEQASNDGVDDDSEDEDEVVRIVVPFNKWQDTAGAAIRAAQAQLEDMERYQEHLGQLSVEAVDVLLRDALEIHQAWLKVTNLLRSHTSQDRQFSVVGDKS